jgi:hypothetical protein
LRVVISSAFIFVTGAGKMSVTPGKSPQPFSSTLITRFRLFFVFDREQVMISVHGSGSRLCDGITRRKLMCVGGLSLFGGMTLPRLLQAAQTAHSPERSAAQPPGPAKSVILFNLRRSQPYRHVRYEAGRRWKSGANSIRSRPVAGTLICKHLPQTSKWMHRSMIRTVTHRYDAQPRP